MRIQRMNMIKETLLLVAALNVFQWAGAQSNAAYQQDFSQPQKLKVVGRGACGISDGVFRSKDAYACFGDPQLKDYAVSFKARAPKNAEQVQIWAGFRTYNRFDRYVVGIKGGLQDDIYLMRLGYMGADEFLAVRPLDFHPVPGTWYPLKVEVCGDRIRVFVNNESKPRIDVTDQNSSLAPSGEIALGGGWIETEFDDLVITPMDAHQLKGVKVEEFRQQLTIQDKEKKRRAERASYQPILVGALVNARTEATLDGNWLFMPEYQLADKEKAVSSASDEDWHVMSVPNFWNPIRIWLHGETMSSPTGPQPKGVSDTYYQQETDRCENYTFDYRKTRAAWYRQWVELPAGVEGKNMTLTFDAVSKVAEIYINGELADSHIGMFGEIKVDGSQLLKPGKNLVVVKVTCKVDNSSSESGSSSIDFFYSSVRESEKEDGKVSVKKDILKEIAHGFYGDDPAGIWQPVKLTITSPVKVEDVFIKPTLEGASFDLTVKNQGGKKSQFDIYTDIIDKETGSVLYSMLSLPKQVLNGDEEKIFTYRVDGLKPRLWTPQHPNLYDFRFRLVTAKGVEMDGLTETSGFRTFESKEGLFFLNGHRYWLRGGNHIPFALAPNNLNLANTFMQLMKAGNIDVTRTHTTPWNKLWMGAADTNGIGVSFEGTWPWLMIHSTPLPDAKLIDMWKKEFITLLKKYRNHPSLLFWTVNNEMKFYDNDNDLERAKEKYRVISDVVKEMRRMDPTRPICFDSNYQTKGKKEKYGADFMNSIDEGDIDDMHAYYNWYDYSLFRFFNGEFQKNFKTPGRPLISQEMSTGYPNNETGHPTRSYQLIHQNPQSLVGYESYDFADPKSFLTVQSFITGELAEALRRSNDEASGIMHFALLTWFRSVYDYQKIDPYPTYYALKRALQPVLVSAELWGRHFYAGEQLPVRICVVNDLEEGRNLQPTRLNWKIQGRDGKVWSSGTELLPEVKHYARHWLSPKVQLPETLPADKSDMKLVLELKENGLTVSTNEYEILLTSKDWNRTAIAGKHIVLLGNDPTRAAFDALQIAYRPVSSIQEALKSKADLCVLGGEVKLTDAERQQLRNYQAKGGKLLLLQSPETAKTLFPEYITGWVKPTEGDIVSMEIPESPLFDGLEKLELRNFNNNKREKPDACDASLFITRNDRVTELASQIRIHGYVDGTMEARVEKMKKNKGFTLIRITDGGEALVSTLCTDKAVTDPIAGKLLVNMINDLIKQNN